MLQNIQQHLDEYIAVFQVGITLPSVGLGFAAKPAFVLKIIRAADPAIVDQPVPFRTVHEA